MGVNAGTTDRGDVKGCDNTGGPLAGLRLIEFVGLGPGPFCAMMITDCP